jgi:hypothetical protein
MTRPPGNDWLEELLSIRIYIMESQEALEEARSGIETSLRSTSGASRSASSNSSQSFSRTARSQGVVKVFFADHADKVS